MRSLPGALACALAATLLLGACGDGDPVTDPSPGPAEEEPTDSPSPTEEPEDPAEAPGVGEVTVWFPLVDASGAWVVPETVQLDEPTVGVLRAAVEALVEGRTSNPHLSTTVVPDGTTVLDVAIEGGVATVDLSEQVTSEGGGSSQEQVFSQQLAHTATQFDSVDTVRLFVEGEPIPELWGHLDWSQPLSADPAALAPIIIEEPAWGATQPAGPVTAAGSSLTFESTVELRLLDPSGAVVEETFTTAAQPDVGERGPWEHTFDTQATAPGTWTVEATEPDPSGGEGRPAFSASVEIAVG